MYTNCKEKGERVGREAVGKAGGKVPVVLGVPFTIPTDGAPGDKSRR